MKGEGIGLQLQLRNDEDLSDSEDEELRALLSLCFPESEEIFAQRRYFLEPPDRRCILRTKFGTLAAHAALRDRLVRSEGTAFVIGGVSEVCVHPRQRAQGHVRRLLARVHDWLERDGVPFSLLFGDERIYASSGYRRADNVFRFWDPAQLVWAEDRVRSALVYHVSSSAWPSGLIDLRGVLY